MSCRSSCATRKSRLLRYTSRHSAGAPDAAARALTDRLRVRMAKGAERLPEVERLPVLVLDAQIAPQHVGIGGVTQRGVG